MLLSLLAGRSYCYRSLDRASSKFRDRGYPTRIAEIIPDSVPEADDAAPLLEQATSLLAALDHDSTEIHPIDALIDRAFAKKEVTLTEAAEVLDQFDHPPVQELVGLARAAAQRPFNVPNLDYSAGPALEIPGISTTRTLSRLVGTRVRVSLTLGTSLDEVWSDISVQFGLAELASHPPTLINSLTSVACRRITFESLQATVDTGRFVGAPDSLLETFLQSDAKWGDNMVNMLHGERLIFFDWMVAHFLNRGDWINEIASLAAVGDSRPTRRVPQFVSSMLRPLAALDLSHAYRYQFEIVDAVARLPSHEVHAVVAEAEQRVISTRWPLTAICAPTLSRVLKTHMACWAEQRVWTIALATASVRSSSGHWPQTISELRLPPELLVDPCSGNPIHFVATPEKIVIYADGLDRKDDGGTPWQSLEDASVERGDIVVELKLSR